MPVFIEVKHQLLAGGSVFFRCNGWLWCAIEALSEVTPEVTVTRTKRKYNPMKTATAPEQAKTNEIIFSPFATKMLAALRRLTKEREAHLCGGFTTDDIEWQMGTAFTAEETLSGALEELQAAKIIRYAGYDEDDAIGHCYELR